MADRLTRRERAAMQLALEVLRFDTAYQARPKCDDEAAADVHAACAALREGARGRPTAWGLYAIVDAALGALRAEPIAGRLIRARLALYLRARLRADAGDCGPTTPIPLPGKTCQDGGHNVDAGGRCAYLRCGCWAWTRRITPLWQSAPETRR